ncbi:SUMF1/EgtB/PvdO family nonheme iron enzyme [Candidatus Latescibacterota bacterium]
MICPKCGKETPDDSQSCVNCGVKFRRVPKKPSPPPPEPPDVKTVQAPITPGGGAKTVVTPSGEGGGKPGDSKAGEPPPKPPKPPEQPEQPTDDMSEEEAQLREHLAGRYEIKKKLGAGGMASVYLAREIALNRDVAIKLLPKAFVRNADFVDRFKNEAQVAANLEHPNIVRIYQISEEHELVYFVMSLIPGGSLTDRIEKKGALPIDSVIRWGMETCSALAYGHSKGVIHRDLKPDNIMLDRNDTVIVMDYGIAKAGEGTGLTQTGTVIGTPQYMSPEQARGKKLDSRSDIYSMGIVLYQMATGELPFQATDAASLMYMHVHENPEPPDARNADVPEWLRNIILKCLSKNPDDRFANAEELGAALTEKYSPKVTATPLRDEERKARKKRLAVTAVVVVIIATGITALVMWRAEQQRTAEQARITQEQQVREAERAEQEQQLAERDDRAWEQAQGMNSRESYNTYLQVYPEGRHIDEATANIAALGEEAARAAEAARPQEETPEERQAREAVLAEQQRRAEEAERARQDDLAFQNAEMVDSEQAYMTYLKNYPQGHHIDDANQRLAAISTQAAQAAQASAEQTARQDDQAFELASRENTSQSYSTYLISYPDGHHSEEARTRIAAFDAREAEAEKVRIALSSMSIRMVQVPGGSFLMGSEGGAGDERPVRKVTLSGFEFSSTEISQGQFNTIVGENPSYFKLDDNNPVERVSWLDAIMFCNRLSEKVGLELCYDTETGACDFTKNGFRLPTEAEWEYACRAESGSDYNLGDGESALDRAGWYQRNGIERTHPGGQKTPNAWGLYDMHGNVWEWCNDWYAEDTYASGAAENPTGPASGSERVLRGGSYLDQPQDSRSAKRRSFEPDEDYSDIGFRIVRRP